MLHLTVKVATLQEKVLLVLVLFDQATGDGEQDL
jgi:hypothetical protein